MKREPLLIKTKHKQTRISEKTGVSQPTVSNWLKGKTKPTGLQRNALQEHYPEILVRIEEEWNKK